MFKLSFDFSSISKERGIVDTDYLPFSYFASMVQRSFIDEGHSFTKYNSMNNDDKAGFLYTIFSRMFGLSFYESYYASQDLAQLKNFILKYATDLRRYFYDTFKSRMTFNQNVEDLQCVKDLKNDMDNKLRSARNKTIGCALAAFLLGGGAGIGVGYPIYTKKDETKQTKDSNKPDIKVDLEKKDKKIPGKLLERRIDKNRRKKIKKLNRQTNQKSSRFNTN